MPRARPLPARERRRILLYRSLFNLAFLIFFLILAQSGAFSNINKEAKGAAFMKVKNEKEKGEMTNNNEANQRTISSSTLELVKYFEGYTPVCEDWLDGHATIGYGNLLHFGPCTVEDNALFVTKEEASNTLTLDLLSFQEAVYQLVKVPINDEIEAALVSFSYNVGEAGLERSTLLSLLNAGDYRGAAGQFTRWINVPSGPLPGLIKRRDMERDLFLQGVKRLGE